jgi:hypothetical protein
MKKLVTIILVFCSLTVFSTNSTDSLKFKSEGIDSRLVIFEISYRHPIEVFYWQRLNNDSTFKSLYKLVMVSDTVDVLSIKDMKTGTKLYDIYGRPSVDVLIKMHRDYFYNRFVVDDLVDEVKNRI